MNDMDLVSDMDRLALDWGVGSSGEQFLTFALGEEQYGIEILRIQEIKGHSRITPIPNAPAHVKGVLNLRGTVVPVVDLRTRFGMPERAYDKFTVIIIVTLRQRVIGLVVDSVSDVLEFPKDRIRPAPDIGHEVDTDFMTGVAVTDEQMIVLLDIDRVFEDQDVAALVAADGQAPSLVPQERN